MTARADLNEIVAGPEPLLGPCDGERPPLDGGIINRNYRAPLGGEDYVIRLPAGTRRCPGSTGMWSGSRTRRRRSLLSRRRSRSRTTICLVTRFIESRPVSASGLTSDPGDAARALRAFHDNSPRLPTRFWVPQLGEDYATIVLARGGPNVGG